MVHALNDVWENFKGFFRVVWQFARDTLGGIATFVGNSIGEGIMSKIGGSLPNWLKRKEDTLIMEERFSLSKSEPPGVNEWYLNRVREGNLSIIERLHFARPICKYDRYGNVLPLSYLKFMRDNRQGLSLSRKYVSPVPFEFFCMTVDDLKAVVQSFAASVNLDNTSMSLTRGDCHVRIEMVYKCDVATHFVHVNRGRFNFSFLIISSPHNSGSINYVLAYRVPGGLLDVLFSKLSCLDPAIEALSVNYVNLDINDLITETNNLCAWDRHGIKLGWQTCLASMYVVAMDKAANLFGLISKVKDNEFDSGLIPKEWCDRPGNLTEDEWLTNQWLLWSLYESGFMLSTTIDKLDPKCHLPARVLDCCVHMWRVVSSVPHLDECVDAIQKYSGGTVRFSGDSDALDPAFR